MATAKIATLLIRVRSISTLYFRYVDSVVLSDLSKTDFQPNQATSQRVSDLSAIEEESEDMTLT